MSGVRLNVLILAAVLASGLVALLPFAWAGANALTLSYREAAERDLTANAGLLALAIPPGGDGGGTRVTQLLQAARAASAARYTLLRRDGSVLADSDEEPGRMENHANRPEVRAVLAGEPRAHVRRSPTLDGDWLYVATALADGRILRAAASMEELNDRLALWWSRGAWGLGLSVVLLLAMGFLLARRLARPIEAAAAAAEKYAAGDFTLRPPLSGSLETRRLSASMSRMAAELDSRFRLITRQQNEMRSVFENMTEGVLAVDNTGTVILSNGAAERLLGASAAAGGWNVAVAVRNADLLDAIREAAAAAEGAPVETQLRVHSGGGAGGGADEDTILAVTAVRMEGVGAAGKTGKESGGSAVLVVLRDVTRLRRLEVMRRDFVANVSHELRTPITTVQSSLEALRDDGVVAPAGGEFLEMALRNARRLGSIVSNLLLLAGMESGGSAGTERERPAPAAVLPVLTEAAELAGAEAAARGTVIDIDCEAGLAAVMAPALAVQAVANLLDNAIKYGPENGRVSVSALSLADGRAQISVADHGPGIAPRHRSRVFERFYRADGSTRAKRGSGLGLAIVSHIAQALGGGVQVESEIGAGSVFRLTLPGAVRLD